MFGYAKKDFEDRINELDEQLISNMLENNECFSEIKNIDSCLKLKKKISKEKKLSITDFACATIMMALSIILSAISGNSLNFVIESLNLVGIFCYGFSLGYFLESCVLKKELKKDYSDFVLVSEQELAENKKQLLDKEKNLLNNIDVIKMKKNRYMEGIRHIELYQSVLSMVAELSNDYYYVADSKKEYQEFLDNKENYSKQFDDYLANVNYTDIYFSNEITDVPVKKLVRK